MPFAAVGAGLALGEVGSSIYSGIQAGNAANAEKDAEAQYLSQIQSQEQQLQSNYAPYLQFGQQAASAYGSALPSLTQGFDPTLSQLQSTPGYQFELTQGENATNNAEAAQGLSGSGAELSALDQYSQGLANNTYQSLASIYNTNRQTTGDILQNALGSGLGAAENLGSNMTNLTSQYGGAITGEGQAKAGGDVGTANAVANGVQGLGNAASVGLLGGNLSGIMAVNQGPVQGNTYSAQPGSTISPAYMQGGVV